MRIHVKGITRSFILAAALIAQIVLTSCDIRQAQEPKQYADYSKSSGFRVTNVDSVSVENLMVLAKVWGFAKYHHPIFATETLNADYELFDLLPRVAYAGKEERKTILLEWIRGLGEFKSAEERLRKEIAEKAYTSPTDWRWLEDTELLGTGLSETLQNLRWADRSKPSRYARFTYTGELDGTESGAGPFFSDTGYDLLTLFRLWNRAEYFFPSVDITNKKWADVLPEYIPKFLRAGEYVKWTTAELIAELSDSHSEMSGNPLYEERRLPVELGFVEGRLVVTDNRKLWVEGEESMFERGDEIVSIGGRTPKYFVERTRKYIAASNENALLRDAARLALHSANMTTPVIVERCGSRVTFDIATITLQEYSHRRSQWVKDQQPYYELLNDSVGYIYPGKFKTPDGAAIMEKLADTEAIIVDLRGYPSDNMAVEFIGRYFVKDTTLVLTCRIPVLLLPGYLCEDYVLIGSDNDDYYKGKVVLLVNDWTQSSAEYHAMAFQATSNCVAVGSQTAGADGNVVKLSLPRGVSTMFSGVGMSYPNGIDPQRVGVRVDHHITPTIEGIRAGRDEVLEKALEIIESE